MAQEVEHICIICGWKYDGRYGKWEKLSDDFECPECKSEKDLFEEQLKL
jgi:rubredoxin